MDDKNKELAGQIRYYHKTQVLSFRQIAEKLKISRDKVARLYAGETLERKPRHFLLDPYRELITRWFSETATLKSVQVWRRLLERGVKVSERAVAEYTESLRLKKKSKTYWPLEFLSGEEAQVDWFFMNHPILGKLAGFTFILSYSRFAFAHLFARHSFEFFIQGHLMAFVASGGIPRALRYDNLKSVVIKRVPLTYNAAFLEFARYYCFEIRLCNPACGNEKGRVERLIRSIRGTFENVAGHHQTLNGLNAGLHEWIDFKNAAIHRVTEVAPNQRKKEEALRALPINPYHNVVIHPPRKPTKTGLVIFDTNGYSLPTYLLDRSVCVHAGVDRVEFYDLKGRKLAEHKREFKRHQTIINPLHRSVTQLSERAKFDRIHAVIKNLAPEMADFLSKNETVGENAQATAYAMFKLLKTHNRETLLSAVREAIKIKSPRLKFILSCFTDTSQNIEQEVSPQNKELLTLSYKSRSLTEYDDEKKS